MRQLFNIHRMIRVCLPMIAIGLSLLSACSSAPAQRERTDEEKARLLLDIANGALVENDPTGALQHLLAAEKLDPKIPELYHSKALAYFGKHDLNSAIEAARYAVKLNPGYSIAQNTLGKLLMDAGRQDEAVPFLQTAAKDPINREAFKALTNLGIISYRKSELDRARDYFDQAVLASPTSACIAYYYRGHVWLKKSDFRKAITDYESATRRFCGNFADAHLALGIAFQQAKQYQQARKKFVDIQNRYPNTNLANQAMDYLKYLP